jgi:hypothetical protein
MGNLVIRPGAQISVAQCPSDFQTSTNSTCQYRCPTGYKYGQGSSGELDRCIYESNNEYSVPLQKIPVTSEAVEFDAERKRFNDELRSLQSTIHTDEEARNKLSRQTGVYEKNALKYDVIKSQYAGFSAIQDAAKSMEATTQSLKPMRPPTQPYSDIEKERRTILEIVSEKIVLAQVALITVLLCAAEYLILPADYAHKLSFLTLSVGIAVGIFLTRK